MKKVLTTISISVEDVFTETDIFDTPEQVVEWFEKNKQGILDGIWSHIGDVIQAYSEED